MSTLRAPVAASTRSTNAESCAALCSIGVSPPNSVARQRRRRGLAVGQREDAVAVVREQRRHRLPVVGHVGEQPVDEHDRVAGCAALGRHDQSFAPGGGVPGCERRGDDVGRERVRHRVLGPGGGRRRPDRERGRGDDGRSDPPDPGQSHANPPVPVARVSCEHRSDAVPGDQTGHTATVPPAAQRSERSPGDLERRIEARHVDVVEPRGRSRVVADQGCREEVVAQRGERLGGDGARRSGPCSERRYRHGADLVTAVEEAGHERRGAVDVQERSPRSTTKRSRSVGPVIASA